MDKVFTREQVSRMLKLDRATVVRLQRVGRLDRVDTSTITNGISESAIKAFLEGKLPTFDRTLKRGTPRGK